MEGKKAQTSMYCVEHQESYQLTPAFTSNNPSYLPNADNRQTDKRNFNLLGRGNNYI